MYESNAYFQTGKKTSFDVPETCDHIKGVAGLDGYDIWNIRVVDFKFDNVNHTYSKNWGRRLK